MFISGHLFLCSIIKDGVCSAGMGFNTISECGRAFLHGGSFTQKTDTLLPGRRGGEHLPETNVLFKGAKVWPEEKMWGVGEGKGRVILKTMYFSFPVNHIALRFLTLWINGINCLGVRGSKCHLGQRSHCSA